LYYEDKVSLVKSCQIIDNAATDNLSELAPYGIDAKVLTGFQNDIDSFNSEISFGGYRKNESHFSIESSLQKCRRFNKKIDVLTEILHASHPDFFAEYKNNRKIISTSAGTVILKTSAT
jgi:hypothetical protein